MIQYIYKHDQEECYTKRYVCACLIFFKNSLKSIEQKLRKNMGAMFKHPHTRVCYLYEQRSKPL